MEITGQLKSAFGAQAEAAAPLRKEPVAPARGSAATATTPEKLQLEQMQETLREMPDVDQARIAEIRRALMSGEISTDARLLAGSIISYHTGSDA